MTLKISQTVAVLADLTDPTSDGMLTKLVNYGLGALMVIVALMGGWFAFKAWIDASGKKESLAAMRGVVFGVIVVQAILGGIILLANYGSSLIPQFMS